MYSQSSLSSVDRTRRQVIQQIIHNNGSGNILLTGPTIPAKSALLSHSLLRHEAQRTEFESLHQNLKVQFNASQAENTRLKTQITNLLAELHRKDKDQELFLSQSKLDVRIQKSLTENYLVSQLKKQIRALKAEL